MTTTIARGSDLLATIVAAAERIVAVRQDQVPLVALREQALAVPSEPRRFEAALSRTDRVNVIAECKRRSPARGVLRQSYDPAAIARAYAEAGAAAISVLTEPAFFDGSLEHLDAVRTAAALPVLRKDFIVTDYQLCEARIHGAAAVLLIVAALDPGTLRSLHAEAHALGLDVLVEVHDPDELAIAIDAGARIVGVNNRNLRTLEVDVRASEAVIARIPPDVVAVSESGLRDATELRHLQTLGFRAFLIGERFMTADDPGQALRELLARCS